MRKSMAATAAASVGRKLATVARASGWAGEARLLAGRKRARFLLGDQRVAVTRRYLEFAIVPLWLLSGLADYICHRRARIETKGGLVESIIHLLMKAEVAIPVTASLLLEVNAGVLAAALAAFAAHEATALWDVAYAVKRRAVSPVEQHVHSALEMVPFCALSFLICLHWDQFQALLGAGDGKPVMRPRWKKPPLPRAYAAATLASAGLLASLYFEELWRCIDASHKGLDTAGIPPQACQLYGSAGAAEPASVPASGQSPRLRS